MKCFQLNLKLELDLGFRVYVDLIKFIFKNDLQSRGFVGKIMILDVIVIFILGRGVIQGFRGIEIVYV